MIECRTLHGSKKLIPVEKVRFRPSAYAVINHDGKILLTRMRSTGAFCLPGGGIEPGETMENGLKREVKEETGIEIEVQKLAFIKEDFFYYDPLDEAFHSFMFFFECKPVTLELIPDDRVEDSESEFPRWIEISTLDAKDFYNDGDAVMNLLSPKA